HPLLPQVGGNIGEVHVVVPGDELVLHNSALLFAALHFAFYIFHFTFVPPCPFLSGGGRKSRDTTSLSSLVALRSYEVRRQHTEGVDYESNPVRSTRRAGGPETRRRAEARSQAGVGADQESRRRHQLRR